MNINSIIILISLLIVFIPVLITVVINISIMRYKFKKPVNRAIKPDNKPQFRGTNPVIRYKSNEKPQI